MLNTFKVYSHDKGLYLPFFFSEKAVHFYKQHLFSFKKYNLKIIGKIFRWYFSTKKIKLSLNHGHINTFFINNLKFIKIFNGKYDNHIIFLSPFSLSRFFFFLELPRKINIFTKRGLFVEKPYNKKLGKVSSYL